MTVRYRQLLAFLPVVLTLAMLLMARPGAVFSDIALFQPLADNPPRAVQLGSAAKRVRPVAINWQALKPQLSEIKLNLFEDVVLTAVRERVDSSPAIKGYVWVGRVLGQENGQVVLSVNDGLLAGSVSFNGIEQYTIRYSAEVQAHLVREVDPTPYIEPAAPDFVVPAAPGIVDTASAPSCEDGSRIDLMVAYTVAARDSQGGTAAIEALINQRVSEMNNANNNSQVTFVFDLVQVTEVNYTESGNLFTDLERLMEPGDGYMDDVHAARDAGKADLVGLYIAEGSGGACGIGYLMNPAAAWFESLAFGVSALDYPPPYSCHPLTLAHEFGHNMGNAHDRANSGNVPYLPYAYGYQAPGNTFRTIMAYDCPNGGCPRINHWSNPDVTVNGQPTGVDYETNPGQAADDARAISELAQVVANFRADCAPPTDTPTPSPTVTATATQIATATVSATPPSPTATANGQLTSTATATLVPSYTATSPPPNASSPTPTTIPHTPSYHAYISFIADK